MIASNDHEHFRQWTVLNFSFKPWNGRLVLLRSNKYLTWTAYHYLICFVGSRIFQRFKLWDENKIQEEIFGWWKLSCLQEKLELATSPLTDLSQSNVSDPVLRIWRQEFAQLVNIILTKSYCYQMCVVGLISMTSIKFPFINCKSLASSDMTNCTRKERLGIFLQ